MDCIWLIWFVRHLFKITFWYLICLAFDFDLQVELILLYGRQITSGADDNRWAPLAKRERVSRRFSCSYTAHWAARTPLHTRAARPACIAPFIIIIFFFPLIDSMGLFIFFGLSFSLKKQLSVCSFLRSLSSSSAVSYFLFPFFPVLFFYSRPYDGKCIKESG